MPTPLKGGGEGVDAAEAIEGGCSKRTDGWYWEDKLHGLKPLADVGGNGQRLAPRRRGCPGSTPRLAHHIMQLCGCVLEGGLSP